MNDQSVEKDLLLAESSRLDFPDLEEAIERKLARRLSDSLEYSFEEINRIRELDVRLFPPELELSEEQTNAFRAMASLSQCALKPSSVRSHRKFIGPVIVALKRITWQLVKVHLLSAFDALQELFSWMVYNQARQSAQIQQLTRQLAQEKQKNSGG